MLNSIRQGVSLRPAGERQLAPLDPQEDSVMSLAMARRRTAISPLDILNKKSKIMDLVANSTGSDEDDANEDDETWN